MSKLEEHYKNILKIKDEREMHRDKQLEHYAKFKEHLGKVQELSRQLSDSIEEGRKFLTIKEKK